MDRNTIIGIVLLIGIIITFNVITQPSEEEIAQQQKELAIQDSIAQAEAKVIEVPEEKKSITSVVPDSLLQGKDSLEKEAFALAYVDSINKEKRNTALDIFAVSGEGELAEYTLENKKIKIHISNKGGFISSAKLKEYQSYDNYMIAREKKKDGKIEIIEPLELFDQDSTVQFLNFYLNNSKEIKTSKLFFTPVKQTKNELVLRANTIDPKKYIEYTYKLGENAYDVNYNIALVGLHDDVDGRDLQLKWYMSSKATEKLTMGQSTNQSRMSSVFYKPKELDREYLTELMPDAKITENSLEWVAFKHCYFSSVILTDEGFDKGSFVGSMPLKTSNYSDFYAAQLNMSRTLNSTTNIPLKFYFGPNDYETLAVYNNQMEDLIDLGITPLRQINQYLIMPVFNLFNGFGWSLGLVIFIVTIMVRILILPLTYKSYQSSARMKVLRPEIQEINEKFKDKDPMKKQQETMALYRKTGVSPMAGCLPAIIQMPLVIAVFRFFPSTIDLRQKSFLWAEDLSTYESVFQLPFEIPAYGSHVSLFTLILAITMIFYTRVNSNQMAMPQQPGAPNMKIIMYMMPVMMLFFFNSYASGLSFYYICGNLMMMLMMWVIKKYMIDENKLRAIIEENKKKPKKKSKFQERMDQLVKQQQAKQADLKNKKK